VKLRQQHQTSVAFMQSSRNRNFAKYKSNYEVSLSTSFITLRQFVTGSSDQFEKDYSKFNESDDEDYAAKSDFGTKVYWDSMYEGMGDFQADEYSWYYGFESIKPILQQYLDASTSAEKAVLTTLIPGCGNDPLLLDLYNSGYTSLTAFDYSQGAIDRQSTMLEYLPMGSDDAIDLRVEDARSLPEDWENNFDVTIEKGALDAIYLSGDGNFEKAAEELKRVTKRRTGLFISCSGVVPEDLRRSVFTKDEWTWLRDGSKDLEAGCFVWRRR